jgi:hypothetical protein
VQIEPKMVQNPDFPVVLGCAARQSRRTAKSGIKKNQWVSISMRNRRRAKTGGFAGFSLARVREVQKLPLVDLWSRDRAGRKLIPKSYQAIITLCEVVSYLVNHIDLPGETITDQPLRAVGSCAWLDMQ